MPKNKTKELNQTHRGMLEREQKAWKQRCKDGAKEIQVLTRAAEHHMLLEQHKKLVEKNAVLQQTLSNVEKLLFGYVIEGALTTLAKNNPHVKVHATDALIRIKQLKDAARQRAGRVPPSEED